MRLRNVKSNVLYNHQNATFPLKRVSSSTLEQDSLPKERKSMKHDLRIIKEKKREKGWREDKEVKTESKDASSDNMI